jgi:hypothetical protein
MPSARAGGSRPRPRPRLRAVDHLGGHFLAAMRRQAVHEQRVGLCATRIMSASTCQSAKALHARLVLGLETHRGPHVGGDQIGAAAGLHRIGELLEVAVP